jgi:predicted HTH domain antitoxin
MVIEIPDSVFSSATTYTPADFKVDIAVWLFERKQLSTGRAAHLAGLDIVSFNKILSQRGIVIRYTETDLETDLQNLSNLTLPA